MDAPEPPSSSSSAPPRKAPTLKELWAQPGGRLLVLAVLGGTLLIGARCSSEPVAPDPAAHMVTASAPGTAAPMTAAPASEVPATPAERLRQSLAAYDALLRDLEVTGVLVHHAWERTEPGSAAASALNEQAVTIVERTRRLRELRDAELAQALGPDTLLHSEAAADHESPQ